MPAKTKQSETQKIPKLRFAGFCGEWEEKRLGEVASFLKGRGISKNDIVKDGKNKCIRYGELYTKYNEIIKDVKSKTNVLAKNSLLSQKDDVLIPSSGETALDIATISCIKEDNVLLGGDLNVTRLKNQSGDFFAYYLSNFQNKNIAKLAQGNSVVHLYASHFKTLKLNLPSLSEQQKIAEFLGSVDEWIENLRAQKENLEDCKKGMMQKIFLSQGGQVPEVRFKDDDGNDFAEWEEKRLGEIGEIFTAPYVEINKNQKSGLWFIDMGSVSPNGNLLLKKYTNSKDNILRKGDLVMPNRDIGHGDIIGKVAQINFDNKYVLGNNMYGIRVGSNLLSKFIFYLINSEIVNREMRKRSNGTSQLQLIRKDVETVKVDIPSFPEQQKIAEFLTSIDNLINSKQQQITQAESWKKGLMQGLFV